MISAVTIAKLIEAHLEQDEPKFLSYANFIADTYEKNGENLKAKIIRSRLDGSYKDKPQVTLDNEVVLSEVAHFCAEKCSKYEYDFNHKKED